MEDADVLSEIIRLESFHMDPQLQMNSTFIEIRVIILISPGELYSPYEKLFLPFDEITWKLLILTFLIAFSFCSSFSA